MHEKAEIRKPSYLRVVLHIGCMTIVRLLDTSRNSLCHFYRFGQARRVSNLVRQPLKCHAYHNTVIHFTCRRGIIAAQSRVPCRLPAPQRHESHRARRLPRQSKPASMASGDYVYPLALSTLAGLSTTIGGAFAVSDPGHLGCCQGNSCVARLRANSIIRRGKSTW